MTRPGAMYLRATQAASDHRLAAGLAAADGHLAAAGRFATAAEHYDAQAATARADGHQLAAARKLRLRGSAGQLPRGYFADAPCSAVPATQGTPTGNR